MCKVEKPRTEFHRHPKTRDRLQSSCKQCQVRPPKKRKQPQPYYVPKTKVCCFCQEEKSAEQFYHRWSAKDGLTSRCKGCFGLRIDKRFAALSPTKTCVKCGINYARTEEFFYKSPDTIDRLQSWCRSCYRGQGQTRGSAPYQKRKKVIARVPTHTSSFSTFNRWVAALKSLCRCSYCDETEPDCLDFHHRDPTQKSFTIGQAHTVRGLTMDVLKSEVLKCDVLCANCHRKLHAGSLMTPRKFRLNREGAMLAKFDAADGLVLESKARVKLAMRASL